MKEILLIAIKKRGGEVADVIAFEKIILMVILKKVLSYKKIEILKETFS